MESVAHSRQPNNKVSLTLPKKTTNGNFSTSKTLYDDVYGGLPKFAASSISPRFEDYREIFASFHAVRASSIPVLDLPAVDAGDVFCDFRSAAFDYAEVFRGFNGLDFWSSHEDLFRDGVSDEEEEAWTRVETDSFSRDLGHFRNNQGIPSGDLFQSVDENIEFNMSYHKINGTSKIDTSKGRTHITPLHAVPGFTHIVDETTHFQKPDPSLQIVDDIELDMEFNSGTAKRTHHRKSKENPSLQVVDDIELDMEFNAGKAKRTHHRKMMSQPCNVTSGEQVLCCDLDPHDGCSRNDFHTSEMFITVSDINLATLPSHLPPPCRPPPALDANKGYTCGFNSNNERIDSEDILGGGSPPFFDVEVDINSSAAVMKEATDRPETRCRSAEELKRRKKGVCDSNIKPSYDVKTNVAKISENMTSFNSLNDERLPATYDRRSSTKKIAATDERQKARKAAPEISEPSEGESFLNIFEEKHAKESRSSQESEQSTGVGTWKEATEFFELVGTNEFGKVILPINHTKSLVQDTGTYVHGSKDGEASNIQDEYKKVKAVVENYQPEECKKKSKAARGAYEQGKNVRRSKPSKEESKQREHGKDDELAEFFQLETSDKKTRMVHQHGKDDELAEFFQLETSDKKTRMVHQHGKTETKVIKADQSGTLKDMVETQPKKLKRVENEKSKEGDGQTLSEVQCSLMLNKNENKLKENEEQQLSMKKQKQSKIMKENEKIQKEALAPEAAARGTIRVKDFEELGKMTEKSHEALKLDKREEHATCKREHEIILKQAKQIENKKGLKEAFESEEFEKSLKGSYKKEESDEGRQRAHGLVENEMGHKVDLEPGLNQTKTKEAFKPGKNEACEKDQSIEKVGEFYNEYGNRFNERGDNKGTREVQKQAPELESNSGNEVQMKHEIESPSNQAYDRERNVSISNEDEDSHSKQSEKIFKGANKNGKYEGFDKALEQMEMNGEGINMKFAKHGNETQETDSDENLLAAHSSSIPEENIGKLDVSQEPVADREIEEARTDCKIDGRKLEETGVENIIANGKIRASEMPEGKGEHSRTEKVDHSVANTDELRFSSEQASTEKNKTVPEMEFDCSNQERKIALEWGEKVKIKQHANVVINQEESKDRNSPTQVKPPDDYRRNSVADEPAAVLEAVNVQNTSQRSRVAHSIKTEERSLNETPVSVEKDAEKMRRERELEKDRLRKIEEMERERERQKDRMAVNRATLEGEREREREKDRMAVEKATFEARDRAHMEARERAERAAFERKTAEARQRALNEARERLEKACAEARDKSYTDKAAAEARLKAERAAVERATAEARERAMEKVKVERTAFVSRERLERSVSDKFGVSFRNDGRQGSSSSDMQDPHFQNPGSSTGSRYPYSVSGASSFIERSEGEGESAERCRARLERHRRTSERAAKALEEKNMRDLLAQKEQSERNRLAETLDSEVRRWSSGKEGNLRALLSTLQYILGHDSGWQPIPLTEVITSAAVKKAYRKATLCVHPDKLQQRGASIQHKYICEKVFDLLKEAWNKFNSEER